MVIHIAVLLLVASHHLIVAEHLVVDGGELAWVPATVLGRRNRVVRSQVSGEVRLVDL